MNWLKEKKKRKKQSKEVKENPPPQPRAREEIDIDAIDFLPSAMERGISRKELKKTAEKIGMPIIEVNAWLKYMDMTDWRFATCEQVNGQNFRRSLRMWHKVEERIREERARRGETGDEKSSVQAEVNRSRRIEALVNEAKVTPEMWELCKERCVNVTDDGCGCVCGIKIPPDRRPDNPYPPENCPKFKALEVIS